MNGTANNYMAGALGIGTTGLTGFSLIVNKNITGATTTYGIAQTGQVQSDVTNTVYGTLNQLNTQATAFTLSNYHHFTATQGTIGANSVVSLQTGFHVLANLTGATTNYGFRGAIPSGSGRFNLYMDGTAQNYVAGNLGIGPGKTVPTVALDISGSALITGSLGVTQGITGSLQGTASFATSASFVNGISNGTASFANTASYSDNFTIGSTLIFDQTLTDYHTVPSSIVGSNNMFSLVTGSYSSAFFKYSVSNGSNSRAGEVMAAWTNGSIQYTDNSTLDIGNTSGVVTSAIISTNTVQFNISTVDSGWKLKSLATFM